MTGEAVKLTKAKLAALKELVRVGHMKLYGRGQWSHPHSDLTVTTRTMWCLERAGFCETVNQGGRVVPTPAGRSAIAATRTGETK